MEEIDSKSVRMDAYPIKKDRVSLVFLTFIYSLCYNFKRKGYMQQIQASRNVVKIAQALGFLLALDDNHKMERVKLIKLLWAADRFHLRKYGRTISDADDYYAMVHGPVCSLALDIAQMNKDKNALSDQDIAFLEEYFTANDIETSMQKEVGDDYLSETDKEALRKAWETFKDKEAFDLADNISHLYPEWSKHSEYFRRNSGRRPIGCKLHIHMRIS